MLVCARRTRTRTPASRACARDHRHPVGLTTSRRTCPRHSSVVEATRGCAAPTQACTRGAACISVGPCVFGYLPLLWRVDAALASLYQSDGRLADAEASIREARMIINRLADTLSIQPLRAQFQQTANAHLARGWNDVPRAEIALSPRELEVLRRLAEGLSDREIAETLSISPRTVMRHVSNIFDKLGVSSRTAAASVAIRKRLV
ncbi:MAG: hypothetical protein DCC58_17785 [Chloroflexi bacterium]|nr:MAG: hypothetical protein DCC58_17785 [Chloroflexota bacterium]